MPGTTARTPGPARPAVLTETEAASRLRLLADLKTELASLGIPSVLARNHRLVLRYNTVPCEPSGPTDPQLHILVPAGTEIATTNGSTYALSSGRTHAATDPAAAARLIARSNEDHQGSTRENIKSRQARTT
jgi:hypothetical protein